MMDTARNNTRAALIFHRGADFSPRSSKKRTAARFAGTAVCQPIMAVLISIGQFA
jgi:hypothetical protein